jgi:hypothetical protein
MPLIKCPACGKDVSTQATSCPNCGHPLAKSGAVKQGSILEMARRPLRIPNGLKSTIVLLFLVAVFASVNSGNQTSNPTTPPKPTTQEDLCRSDWTKCADNERLVNSYSDWSLVQVRCKRAANDSAKYGNPDWPWFPFGTFYKGDNYVTSGIAIAVEPDAQFSNGFGAMVHSKVICTYDLRAKRVADVTVSPR